MENEEVRFIEDIMNWTLPGLTFFYRDCEMEANLISKYIVGQIIRSQIFVDVSSFAGRLMKSCRYIIASSKAAPLYELFPDVEKWKLHVINANSYFKVLDIYQKKENTQIFLLHIPAKGVNLFKNASFNINETDFIEKARESFDIKMEMPPCFELEEEEWIARTSFPIGLDGQSNFLPLTLKQDYIKYNPEAKNLYDAIYKMTKDNELNQLK